MRRIIGVEQIVIDEPPQLFSASSVTGAEEADDHAAGENSKNLGRTSCPRNSQAQSSMLIAYRNDWLIGTIAGPLVNSHFHLATSGQLIFHVKLVQSDGSLDDTNVGNLA